MVNEWMRMNSTKVNMLIHQLDQIDLSGNLGGQLDSQMIKGLVSSAYKEISRLQNDYNMLKSKYDKLVNEQKAQEEAKKDK